jgi:mersacidin/lichenicidin family type 2 lantibiotic
MSHENIIRAWKDEGYRQNLSEAEREQLPDHPGGLIELSHSDLDAVGGMGRFTKIPCSAIDACPSALGCTLRGCPRI